MKAARNVIYDSLNSWIKGKEWTELNCHPSGSHKRLPLSQRLILHIAAVTAPLFMHGNDRTRVQFDSTKCQGIQLFFLRCNNELRPQILPLIKGREKKMTFYTYIYYSVCHLFNGPCKRSWLQVFIRALDVGVYHSS